jgi:glutamine amidotransferase
MCRWLAYQGDPIYMDELVYKPEHSLVNQSIDARKAVTRVNADGFGLGWYTERETPGLFHEVLPAWGDANLVSLTHHIRTHRFMAHVRSSTGTSVSRSNCHPFVIGNWMFLHNGQIAEFESVRFELERRLPEHLYLKKNGTTDSELMFLMMFKHGLLENPANAIQATFDEIKQELVNKGIDEAFKASICLSDGENFWVARYSTDLYPPTVYMREDENSLVFASEPLEKGAEWAVIPEQSLLYVVGRQVYTHALT